jgi:hypothetical protein
MALAFSGSDIVRIEAIDGSTAAGLFTAIHTALTAAGWLSSAMAGGNKYRLQSPQGLIARCQVLDASNVFTQRVSVQFTSDDEARIGYLHYLQCGPDREFQIWANVCQVFISRPGLSDASGSTDGDCVCGGVPWVANPPGGIGENKRPDDCEEGLPDEPDTDVWWSCGDHDNGGGSFYRENFRTGYRPFLSWSACYRSDLLLHAGPLISYRSLRLVPVTEMYDVDTAGDNPQIRWIADGEPLLLDPLLAWGLTAFPDQKARVRAEVWDACLVSMDFELDSERELDGKTYINFTHSTDRTFGRGSFFCTLHLLKARPLEPPPVAANYAY